MDTGEDDTIGRDTVPMTSPIRLWRPWQVECVPLSPDASIWFVTDGDTVQVPCIDGDRARDLCEVLLFVEWMSSRSPVRPWVKFGRRLVFRAVQALNRVDPRWPVWR